MFMLINHSEFKLWIHLNWICINGTSEKSALHNPANYTAVVYSKCKVSLVKHPRLHLITES